MVTMVHAIETLPVVTVSSPLTVSDMKRHGSRHSFGLFVSRLWGPWTTTSGTCTYDKYPHHHAHLFAEASCYQSMMTPSVGRDVSECVFVYTFFDQMLVSFGVCVAFFCSPDIGEGGSEGLADRDIFSRTHFMSSISARVSNPGQGSFWPGTP